MRFLQLLVRQLGVELSSIVIVFLMKLDLPLDLFCLLLVFQELKLFQLLRSEVLRVDVMLNVKSAGGRDFP